MRTRLLLWITVGLIVGMAVPTHAQSVDIEVIATALNNPRGVGVLPDGRLLVVEAGTGGTLRVENTGTGRILALDDLNGDDDYNDADERQPVLADIPSYNSLRLFATGHDEVFGLGDLSVLPDGRVFFTKDDPFAERARGIDDVFYGDTGIFELDAAAQTSQVLVNRSSTVNGIAYHPDEGGFFATESGQNQLTFVPMDGSEPQPVAEFPLLPRGNEPVPSGVAVDPTTGDVLVSLFSGYLKDYGGMELSFLPNSSKVVRYNPASGTVTDEITGLTTAVDVTVDVAGNVFVAEITTRWPPGLMPISFDLEDPNAPPDPGGYLRFTGRVSMYPADGGEPVVLLDDFDTPTSLTYHDGALYVSSGLGTPGRTVFALDGLYTISGKIHRLTGF